jgi:hypothetical protein
MVQLLAADWVLEIAHVSTATPDALIKAFIFGL